MSSVYDPNGNVGLGVPWTVLEASTYSGTLSNVSSRTPIPAQPVADQDSDALPIALNEWESPPASSPAYKLRIQHGGNVGGGATWAWKGSDEADTSYRGHDWPTRVRRMWAAAAQTGETAGAVDMVTLPSGRVVVVAGVRTAASANEIRALWIEDETLAGGTAAGEIVLASEDSADPTYRGWSMVAAAGYPSVVYWEEERLVLCAVRYLYATGRRVQVAIFQSADEGVTWTLRTPTALAAPIVDTTRGSYGSLVLRRCGGSWVLLDEWRDTAGTPVLMYTQWAGTSPDEFVEVESSTLDAGDPATGAVQLHAAGDGDGLVVVGSGYDSGAPSDVGMWRLGSAWMPLSEATRVSMTLWLGSAIAGSYPAVTLDPDGTLWAVYVAENEDVVHLVYSRDRGETWWPGGFHPLETDASAPIRYLGISTYRGGLLLHVGQANGASWLPGTLRSFLVALGGWDNSPLPYLPRTSAEARIGFGQESISGMSWGAANSSCLSWFPPVDLTTPTPNATLLGAAPVSAFPDGDEPTITLGDAGAGSYIEWRNAAGVAIKYDTQGFIGEVDCALTTAGASTSADNVAIKVRLPNAAGSAIVHVSIRLGPTDVVLFDEAASGGAGAALATVAIPGTTRREYRLVIAGTRVAMSYRVPGEQVWTQVTATASTGAAAVELITVGAIATAGQTMTVYRVSFVGTSGPRTTTDLSYPLAVAHLLGRRCAPAGVPMRLGIQVGWRRGPLHPGHTWTLGETAEYPPESVLCRDYPSPSDAWESSTDGVQMEWVWEPLGGQLWRPPGALFFLAVLAADGIDQIVLAGRDDAGTYQDLVTANLASGSSGLSYSAPTTGSATGGALRPAGTGTAATRPWRENELAGGWVRVATSGAAYRITGNTPGLWSPDAALRPTVYVDGWDDTEPATGTLTIYPPGSLHVSAEQDPAEGYDRIRLRIVASADTVEGRYRLKVAIGSVFLPGRRYSYGRNPSVEPVARGVETAGGRSFYDPNQPLRRYARFAWADPYGTRDYHSYSASGPNALLLASGGAHAHSFVSATHRELEGIMRLLGGPGRCLVYLPRVESQLTAWSTTDPERWLYGRITSALTTPRPYGDEGVREEVTVSELTMAEEV